MTLGIRMARKAGSNERTFSVAGRSPQWPDSGERPRDRYAVLNALEQSFGRPAYYKPLRSENATGDGGNPKSWRHRSTRSVARPLR